MKCQQERLNGTSTVPALSVPVSHPANDSTGLLTLYLPARTTMKKKLFTVLCRVQSPQRPWGEGKGKTAASAGTGACLPPEVESEERTTGTAWAGWGWTQAPWGETES